jgi:hypothetical protein
VAPGSGLESGSGKPDLGESVGWLVRYSFKLRGWKHPALLGPHVRLNAAGWSLADDRVSR